MSVLKKNGHEIGRINEAWWSESYRSNGWILRNHGTGWRRFGHQPMEDIEDAYRCARDDFEANSPAWKEFAALTRKLFTLRQLGLAQCLFENYSGRTERNVPVMGDVDGFWSDCEDAFGANVISHDDAKQLLDLHLQHRLWWEEGLWAIVIERGGATDTPTVVEIMMGDKTQRQKRMQFHAAFYKQHGYMNPKIIARPAKRAEVDLYKAVGNEIWRPK